MLIKTIRRTTPVLFIFQLVPLDLENKGDNVGVFKRRGDNVGVIKLYEFSLFFLNMQVNLES